MLLVDTTPTPHDSPAVFRLESVIDSSEFQLEVLTAITDLSNREDKNSGFESKQETVTVTVFSKGGRHKSETLLKSELNF